MVWHRLAIGLALAMQSIGIVKAMQCLGIGKETQWLGIPLWLGEATTWSSQMHTYGLAWVRQWLEIHMACHRFGICQLRPYGLMRQAVKCVGLVSCIVWEASV